MVFLIHTKLTTIHTRHLKIQHVQKVNTCSKGMRPIILSPAACVALPHLSTLAYRRHDFRKIFVENVLAVNIFSTTFG